MKRVLFILLLFLVSFFTYAQDFNFQEYVEIRMNQVYREVDIETVFYNLKHIGESSDSTALATDYAASSYDGWRAYTKDGPGGIWRIFMSDGTNWNEVSGSGSGSATWSSLGDLDQDIRVDTDGAHSLGSATAQIDSLHVEELEIYTDVNFPSGVVDNDDISDGGIQTITETENAATRSLDENDVDPKTRGLNLYAAPTGTKLTVTLDSGTANDWINVTLITSGDSVVFTPGAGVTIHGDTLMTYQYQIGYIEWITSTDVMVKIEQRDFFSWGVAASDETTAITVGVGKTTFRMPTAMTVVEVRASLTTAGGTSGTTTIDINEGGTTILSTKLTIDAGEKTSITAASSPVISDATLSDDAEITIDVDAISGDATEAGLKIVLIGYR